MWIFESVGSKELKKESEKSKKFTLTLQIKF
jgi:hypothetical protein